MARAQPNQTAQSRWPIKLDQSPPNRNNYAVKSKNTRPRVVNRVRFVIFGIINHLPPPYAAGYRRGAQPNQLDGKAAKPARKANEDDQ